MKVCGIDPGKGGAIVILDGRDVIFKSKTPVVNVGRGTKKDYDTREMLSILTSHDLDLVVIEKQQAFPGQGVSSTFQTGLGYGIWIGLLTASRHPYEEVRPSKWIKAMVPGSSGSGKGAHCLAAKRILPTIDLRKSERARKDDDGIADAALLAVYGQRHLMRLS